MLDSKLIEKKNDKSSECRVRFEKDKSASES